MKKPYVKPECDVIDIPADFNLSTFGNNKIIDDNDIEELPGIIEVK